ncbi:putative nuclease HARBI1 [Mya arenaria]|uniref:putative nuclease HARBI1 n=1 Tax=Mya arenaria TaxID=6604 RepID=UPI0022E967D8|nr:putative nuclease HARBI1 [Mya arenaria]
MFIRWPDQAEQDRTKAAFRDVAGFPCVIGLIDGTHVRVMKPSNEQERGFINRKGFPSINVMAVCDEKGSLCPSMPSGQGLLMTALYAYARYLLTPFRTADTDRKAAYNRAHCRTCVIVESTFGRWKKRFGILHGEVRLVTEKAPTIIMACAVLHNIAIILGEPEVDGDGVGLDGNVGQQFIGRETGFHTREYIVQQYFQMLEI